MSRGWSVCAAPTTTALMASCARRPEAASRRRRMLLTRLVRPAYPLLARARRSKLLPLLNAFDYREAQSPRPVPLGAHVRAVGARAARLRRFEMTDKESAPPTDSFDRLLAWLNPDREQAGQRYEEIRRRLIKIFARRGCSEIGRASCRETRHTPLR